MDDLIFLLTLAISLDYNFSQEVFMGYLTKVQVIERANNTRQFYLICPAPLAQALELEKGEDIEWIIEDKHTLIVRRKPVISQKGRR
jgi:hypothetical protein